MQMAVRTEEREGLRAGQRMVRLNNQLLCEAVRMDRTDAVVALLAMGVPPSASVRASATDAVNTPALVVASAAGSMASVQLLLDARASVDVRGPANASPLTVACRYGHAPTLALLLRAAEATLDTESLAALLSSESDQVQSRCLEPESLT